jgi:hypothetical protein
MTLTICSLSAGSGVVDAPVNFDDCLAPREFRAIKILSVLAACLLTALPAGITTSASAAPLSLFQYEAYAQQHCPADAVVWLDLQKRTYYGKGQRLYARGKPGTFVCRDEARKNGYRRSLLGHW